MYVRAMILPIWLSTHRQAADECAGLGVSSGEERFFPFHQLVL